MGFLFHQRQPETAPPCGATSWSAVGWMMDLFSVNGRTSGPEIEWEGARARSAPSQSAKMENGRTRLHTRCIRFDRDRDVSGAAVLDLGGVICNEGK